MKMSLLQNSVEMRRWGQGEAGDGGPGEHVGIPLCAGSLWVALVRLGRPGGELGLRARRVGRGSWD